MSNNNWGNSVWTFLHVLAEKMNPEAYKLNTVYVVEVVKNVCYNLPCPTCSQHARSYLNRVSIESIKDVEQLKQMLYNFHNSVNLMRGHKAEKKEILNRYKSITIEESLWNLQIYYAKRYRSALELSFITNDSLRKDICNNIIVWITKYRHLFK